MKKEFTDRAELDAFIEQISAEKKYVYSMVESAPGVITVEWQEHKTYVAHDGREFLDEVWTTQDGTMIQIQDLSPEHARNIIRMMLRNEREAKEMANVLVATLKQAMEDWQDADTDQIDKDDDNRFDERLENMVPGLTAEGTRRTLH